MCVCVSKFKALTSLSLSQGELKAVVKDLVIPFERDTPQGSTHLWMTDLDGTVQFWSWGAKTLVCLLFLPGV